MGLFSHAKISNPKSTTAHVFLFHGFKYTGCSWGGSGRFIFGDFTVQI
jgi:hypothetical protein